MIVPSLLLGFLLVLLSMPLCKLVFMLKWFPLMIVTYRIKKASPQFTFPQGWLATTGSLTDNPTKIGQDGGK